MLYEFFISHYLEFCVWLTIVYVAVTVAVALDLITGIRKSRINGTKMNSRGLKRTCSKLTHYLLPMVAFTLVDVVIAVKFAAPWLTLTYGAFCIICEACSIFESAADKHQLRRSADMLARLRKLDNKEAIDLLEQFIREFAEHQVYGGEKKCETAAEKGGEQ